jgi:hypothetical protein
VIILGRIVCNFCGRDMGYVFAALDVHACAECIEQGGEG